jgi:hypothetical protein
MIRSPMAIDLRLDHSPFPSLGEMPEDMASVGLQLDPCNRPARFATVTSQI